MKADQKAQQLNAEWHARPGLRANSPLRCSHLVQNKPDGYDLSDHVGSLCEQRGLPGPDKGTRVHTAQIDDCYFKWEQHTESITTTIMLGGNADVPFSETSLDFIQQAKSFLAQKDDLEIFSGAHIEVVKSTDIDSADGVAYALKVFDSTSITGGWMSDRFAQVWTTFQPDTDGFTRLLIIDYGLTEGRLSRLIQRLLDIETYRMLAMLALPVARKSMVELGMLEPQLVTIISALAADPSEAEQEKLLGDITSLAARVEHLVSVTAYRFAAAKAYEAIVHRRFSNIREEIHDGHQRISTFIEKSLDPAMRTCVSAENRAHELAERVGRAARLLDSVVDMALKVQNRAILTSMEKRGRLQVLLQQSVEGFSIFAITYYGVGLAQYGLKAMKAYDLPVDPALLTAALIPIFLVGSWYAVRRVKHRIHHSQPEESAPWD